MTKTVMTVIISCVIIFYVIISNFVAKYCQILRINYDGAWPEYFWHLCPKGRGI